MRRITTITASLAVALAALAMAVPASAVTMDELEQANWDCAVVPITPDPHCARPGGLQKVLTGEARKMTFLVFEPDGTFLGTELLVRGDVFRAHGKPPCPTDPPTGEYTHLLPVLGIDYYACHRFDSDHT